jgi:hypothetical protein
MLLISVATIAWNWDAYTAPAAYVTVATVALIYSALVVLMRMALGTGRRRSELIRAGVLHLYISLGTLIPPFAGLMDRLAVIAVVSVYAVPLLVACLHDGLTWE